MIQIQLIDELYRPMLTCDQCGQWVQHMGNVHWTVDPATAMPNGGPFLTHKHCHDLFVAQWPHATWMWAELPTFMSQLVVNGQVQLGA
jgi:hypothetical protein